MATLPFTLRAGKQSENIVRKKTQSSKNVSMSVIFLKAKAQLHNNSSNHEKKLQ